MTTGTAGSWLASEGRLRLARRSSLTGEERHIFIAVIDEVLEDDALDGLVQVVRRIRRALPESPFGLHLVTDVAEHYRNVSHAPIESVDPR